MTIAGAFLDHDLLRDRTRALCAAAAAPLYVGLATPEQAQRTAQALVVSLYRREGKRVEKCLLVHTPEGTIGGGGGEYPLQDGFGWTSGVTRRLLHEVTS